MAAADLINNISATGPAMQNVAAHGGFFYQSAEFWVGVAFIVVICALYVPVKKILKEMIIKRIVRIKSEFQEAENLKLKAQKLYADYERKFLNADAEVTQIIAEQEDIIAETKERKIRELNNILKQKQKEVDGRIELAFEQANAEINTLVSAKIADILKAVISSKLTKADYNRLIDNSIDNIQKHL